jgi:hypothetical protein
VSFFFIHDASNNNQEIIVTQPHHLEENNLPKGEVKIISPINGTWYSTNDGAILTINGNSFIIETPAVDGSNNIKGSIKIYGNTAVFQNSDSKEICKNSRGEYFWEIKQEQNVLIFKLKKDNCTARSEKIPYEWKRM